VPENVQVSMQGPTAGAIQGFLELEKCECFKVLKTLSFMAGELIRYEEENILLEPKVLIGSSIDEFISTIPGGRAINIGYTQFDDSLGKIVLKQCAPLARESWSIFIERSTAGDMARFGVLSYLDSPTSLTLREMVTIAQEFADTNKFLILSEKIDSE